MTEIFDKYGNYIYPTDSVTDKYTTVIASSKWNTEMYVLFDCNKREKTNENRIDFR